MPSFDPWDIVKVPFPYTDRPIRQRRPALVIGSPMGCDGGLLWVLMITSASHRGWPGDVALEDFLSCGLPVPSIVRTAKIATIDRSAAEPLGHLSASSLRAHVLEHIGAVLQPASNDITAAGQKRF